MSAFWVIGGVSVVFFVAGALIRAVSPDLFVVVQDGGRVANEAAAALVICALTALVFAAVS